MKVFFVSARGDSFGGASLHVRDLSRRLMDDGHQVRIAVGGAPDMEVPQRFAEQDLDFVCIPAMGRSINPFRDGRAILRLRREMKKFAPDLVSTHASKGGALGRLACLGLKIPVLYTPHCWSFVDGFPKAKFYRAAEKFLAPLASKVIAVSEDERSFGLAQGVGEAERTQCIHNGVIDQVAAPAGREPEDSEPVKLVMVGRFEEQKDQPLLLRALAALEQLPWQLTMVGDGPLKGDCEALARELSVADRVNFVGYSSAVEGHLAAADVFTLVSNWEGFPRSILEAMRAGLPVVVSDVGGCREAVIEGVSGRVVGKGAQDELETALREVLSDAGVRRRMGQAGRRLFEERFTFEHMYRNYQNLYQSLASKSPAARISKRSIEA